MMAAQWLVFGLAACLAGMPTYQQSGKSQSQPQLQPMRAEDLTLEKLYRSRSYAGPQARGAAFNHVARYLPYLWNPYGENGADLYI
jgi:hypothetical protein